MTTIREQWKWKCNAQTFHTVILRRRLCLVSTHNHKLLQSMFIFLSRCVTGRKRKRKRERYRVRNSRQRNWVKKMAQSLNMTMLFNWNVTLQSVVQCSSVILQRLVSFGCLAFFFFHISRSFVCQKVNKYSWIFLL